MHFDSQKEQSMKLRYLTDLWISRYGIHDTIYWFLNYVTYEVRKYLYVT